MHHHHSSNHHSNTGKKSFWGILWNIVFVFFYPIITTFALLFVGLVYVFSSLSRLLSRISPSKETVIEIKKPTWEPFASCETFAVERLWVDEIMFGPSYYKLRTKPEIQSVKPFYFGEFKFSCFGGLLLQKWNTTVAKDLPDFDVVFINGATGELQTIGNIKAFSWKAEAVDDDTVVLKWFTGTQGGQIEIHRKDLIHNSSVATE